MQKMTPKQRRRATDMVLEIQRLQQELFKVGLHYTSRKIGGALNVIGYELCIHDTEHRKIIIETQKKRHAEMVKLHGQKYADSYLTEGKRDASKMLLKAMRAP